MGTSENGDSFAEAKGVEWFVTFAATMVPFTAFYYGHTKGLTGKAVNAVVHSPLGVYGLLALPFVTLGMEKCIYDTVQSIQGINPKVVTVRTQILMSLHEQLVQDSC
jgi:hypothetical protein